MDVSPNALRKETVQVLSQVEAQIETVRSAAKNRGILEQYLTDQNGSYVMIPLLLAKTQCLATLTQLNGQGRR